MTTIGGAHARPKQLPPPGNWRIWLQLAGRGAGKTRSGAEWVRGEIEKSPIPLRVAVVGETAADVRDVMVQGPSGLLAVCPPWFKPVYQPTNRELRWPNGSIAKLYSADSPDQLRGPQHHIAWVDEPAKFRYLDDLIENLELGLRLESPFRSQPQMVVTGTPKPIRYIRELLKDPNCITVRGSTYENEANLAPGFIARIKEKYEGTRLGQQEIYAEVLENLDSALWKQEDILHTNKIPSLARVVVGVDPSGSYSTETGIIVAGINFTDWRGINDLPKFYILDDMSVLGNSNVWASTVSEAALKWSANSVIAERNYGGVMVEDVLQTTNPLLNVELVTASRGKKVRAEPVSNIYQQNRAWHYGYFPELEEEYTTWLPDDPTQLSPNRLDAAVWAMTDLIDASRSDASGVTIA